MYENLAALKSMNDEYILTADDKNENLLETFRECYECLQNKDEAEMRHCNSICYADLLGRSSKLNSFQNVTSALQLNDKQENDFLKCIVCAQNSTTVARYIGTVITCFNNTPSLKQSPYLSETKIFEELVFWLSIAIQWLVNQSGWTEESLKEKIF